MACRGRARRRGFTLIELLVVVAIIALLISILLPSLSRARAQTKAVVCASRQKQIILAALQYDFEYKRLPGTHSFFRENEAKYKNNWYPLDRPGDWRLTWIGCGTNYLADLKAGRVPREGTLFKYVKAVEMYLCPSDYKGTPRNTPDGGGSNGVFSYSMSAWAGYSTIDRLLKANVSYTSQGKVWGKVTPAKYPLFFEEHPLHNMADYPDGNFNYSDRPCTRHSLTRAKEGKVDGSGITNLAFLDGHVGATRLKWTMTAEELFYNWKIRIGTDVNIQLPKR